MARTRSDERSLRIGLLTHSVNPRGGVVHTLELATALHAAGHAVTVFAPAAAGERLFRSVPCELDLVPVERPSGGVAAMVEARIAAFERHLGTRLQAQPFDVLHAQDPIGANALADLQQRGLVDRFFRTVHHLDSFDDPRLAARQQRGFASASRVFCVSRVWRDRLWRDHRIEASVVDNGVDTGRWRRNAQPDDAAVATAIGLRAGAAAGAPVFLAVGGVEERKNTVRVLQAFLQVRERWPAAQLVIAGGASLLDHSAYSAAFRCEVEASGLATGPGEPLLLTGALPDAAMPALFRRADAVLVASLREGFGLVVLEALACGTPVVASRIAPFTEYLGDADCCWADPHDAASIAAAMECALAPARAAALAAVTPTVCLRFNWAASAARHVAIYRADLALRPAGRETRAGTSSPRPEGTLSCR